MSNLQHRVEKLRLKRGDILVCRDPDTARALSQMKFPYLSFVVPIVFAPGGLEKLPVDELQKIMLSVRETSRIILPNKL